MSEEPNVYLSDKEKRLITLGFGVVSMADIIAITKDASLMPSLQRFKREYDQLFDEVDQELLSEKLTK